jgi:ParB/RepB/Spo0J family partition protein
VQTPGDQERDVDLAELGDGLSGLRLCEASALEAMRRSLARHGQLDALSVFEEQGHLEVLDGFKRVRAARALGWRTLRARVADVDRTDAKVLLIALHDRRGLTELEEAWLIRSLYREHNLSQPTIAARLGRHKSWVFRRLMLVEALDPAVQADVRLGLLAPRAAVAVSQLPRGNQHDLAGLVIRRGLTVRQTELVVAELLDLDSDAARARDLARRLEGAPDAHAGGRATRGVKSEIDWLAGDIRTVRLVAARLEARLAGGSLRTIGPEAAAIAEDSLLGLVPVLDALRCRIDLTCAPRTSLTDKDAA